MKSKTDSSLLHLWIQILDTNPFYVFQFFLVRIRVHSASMTSPVFQRADLNSCNSGKRGDIETKKELSRNNTAEVNQGPGFSSRNIHNTISEILYIN